MTRSVALLAAAALAGCAGDSSPKSASGPGKQSIKELEPKPPRFPRLPRCPSQAANCKAARGTVIYVEAVDPDGDGDAHFVLTSTQSITAPGITVLDIEKSLRPHPLPGIGARLAAAGPVYTGSHGQKQIQATTLRVGR